MTFKAPDPKQVHEMDQCMASIKQHTIPQFYNYYQGCLEAGFDKEQSLTMTIEFQKIILTSRKDPDDMDS